MPAPILIVGGSPETASAATLRGAAVGCAAAVAVDRGLEALMGAGIPCDLFCGDADSVSGTAAALVASEDPPFSIERYNPHKDSTDLALALRAVGERWGEAPIRCTCLSGGRPDHALAVLGCLAAWGGPVELVEEAFTGRILRAGERWELEGGAGRLFSLVPLSPCAVVSEQGMRWELDRCEVTLLSDLGISNVVEAERAIAACHEGDVGCWLFR